MSESSGCSTTRFEFGDGGASGISSPTSLVSTVTDMFIRKMLLDSGSSMDPGDIAELKPFAPNVCVEYRPPDAALICTLLPTETKAKVLPPSRDMEESINSLFAVTAAPHQEDQSFRIDVARIDCQELRLCLLA